MHLRDSMTSRLMQLEYGKPYTEIDLTALGFRITGLPTADFAEYKNGHEKYMMRKTGNGRMEVYICWNYSYGKKAQNRIDG